MSMDTIASWDVRHWTIALLASLVVTLAIGIPSDVIPNPVFGRPVDVTWWSYPVLVVTAALGGLLAATYVSNPTDASEVITDDELDRPGKVGGLGGVLSFFAVGCSTCNKLVVLAIGSTGALDWFAPAQPILAGLSVGLLGWAVRTRLRNAAVCRIAA
jgi:hypothetical protein